uniref:(northern house mosquito) hypothetical protein n=1 Tax=Culex pipiens TaxID=7175 RepID=A0A8D8HX50_CULPI
MHTKLTIGAAFHCWTAPRMNDCTAWNLGSSGVMKFCGYFKSVMRTGIGGWVWMLRVGIVLAMCLASIRVKLRDRTRKRTILPFSISSRNFICLRLCFFVDTIVNS